MFTNKSLFLTIDQGGHASRAIVFDIEGEVVAHSEHPIRTLHPQPSFVEHDAQDLLQSIRDSLTDVMSQLGDEARFIQAAGLATQRSNVVCWDRTTGAALSPIISWQDSRAHAWLRELHLDRDDVHRTTGLFPSAHYGASKLHWCLHNIQAVTQAQQEGRLMCGPMSSFLVRHLVKDCLLYTSTLPTNREV